VFIHNQKQKSENTMKKLISFIVCLSLMVTILPPATIKAENQITTTKSLKGRNYTTSPKLASKLDDIFKGKVGLYSGGQEVKVPVGSSKLTENNMFSVQNKTTGKVTAGWQCYIYANAVYNALFNECVEHGDMLEHSKKVINQGGNYLTYKAMKKADVRCGAYMRVATSYNNGYNDDYGHSLIILSYDKEGIAYLEGNSNNYGLVCVIESTWDEFNSRMLTRLGRKVCHIIQPKNSYYDKLYNTPSKVNISKIKETKKTNVKLKWKKVKDINGYQIKYSTSKNFDENLKTKKAKATAKSKTIQKLEAGETYYFKIRAYKKSTKKIYGKWSSVKKIHISEPIVEEPITTEPTPEIPTEVPTIIPNKEIIE